MSFLSNRVWFAFRFVNKYYLFSLFNTQSFSLQVYLYRFLPLLIKTNYSTALELPEHLLSSYLSIQTKQFNSKFGNICGSFYHFFSDDMYTSSLIVFKRMVVVRMWWWYDLSLKCGALGTRYNLFAIRHIGLGRQQSFSTSYCSFSARLSATLVWFLAVNKDYGSEVSCNLSAME